MGRTTKILFGTLLLLILPWVASAYAANDLTFADEIASFEAVIDYGTYLESYLAQGADRPNRQVYVFGDRYSRTNMDVELVYSE